MLKIENLLRENDNLMTYPQRRQHMNPDVWDPSSTTRQFRQGQRVTVYMPNVPGGQITGTFLEFVPPSTAVIQTDSGQMIHVDINQITAAGSVPLPSTPAPAPGTWPGPTMPQTPGGSTWPPQMPGTPPMWPPSMPPMWPPGTPPMWPPLPPGGGGRPWYTR